MLPLTEYRNSESENNAFCLDITEEGSYFTNFFASTDVANSLSLALVGEADDSDQLEYMAPEIRIS